MRYCVRCFVLSELLPSQTFLEQAATMRLLPKDYERMYADITSHQVSREDAWKLETNLDLHLKSLTQQDQHQIAAGFVDVMEHDAEDPHDRRDALDRILELVGVFTKADSALFRECSPQAHEAWTVDEKHLTSLVLDEGLASAPHDIITPFARKWVSGRRQRPLFFPSGV